MADEFGDKTEAPTPRKREEAREQGQVAKSTDLVASLSLLFGVLMLGWFGPGLGNALKNVVAECLSVEALKDLHVGSAGTLALRGITAAAVAAAPLMVGLVLVAILGNIVQTGLSFSPAKMMPKLDALSPIKGIKKLFGGWQTLAQLGMNLGKLTIVGMVGYSAIHGRLGEIVSSQQLDHVQAFGMAAGMVYQIGLRVAVILLILSIIDYSWRKFKLEQDLKMTKQEVKDEMKRMEGDPMMKQRRRQIANKMARDRQKQAVPTADVVITNPTEYAVALKYDSKTGNAPRVVAKGRGLIAAEIRRIAIVNGVPILERPPLARALHKMVEVGQEIPEEYYTAVAEILAYVYELTGKMRNGRATAGAA